MKFEELDLSDNVLDALYDMRFEECTPVQEKCIPPILEGRDVLGVAQTGTGKTAAYLLPILSKLDEGGYPEQAINCVIMSPTRELAQQIDQAMQGFSYYLDGVSSVAVYGGNDGNRYDQEVKSLRLGADVVIATPGRFISHISMGNVDMSKVSFFVLDEADRMLDMGFSEDIMTIAKRLPQNCQTIMFSATMPDKIEELAKTLLKDPIEVKLAVSKPAEKIKQSAYVCYETQKMDIIKDIFKAGDLKRVIIFCGSKMKVKQVAGNLQRQHINCGEMHSDLEQAERDEMMFKFKSGQYDVLVATDIVARGIDIDDIAMVINYDVPHDAEDYVHRIGRTARAERDGIAITFVSEEDMFYFQQIEKFLEKDITKNPLPEGMEGPEYKQLKRPVRGQKTSAKSRRRKDRDQTSHKDKKQRNQRARNEAGRQHEPRKDGEKQQSDTNEAKATQPQDEAKQAKSSTPKQPNGNKPDTGEDKPQGSKRRRNKRNKPAGQPSDEQQADKKNNKNNPQKASKKGQQAQDQQAAKDQAANAQAGKSRRKKRRGNVEGNFKKRQTDQPIKSNKYNIPEPPKQQGGLKKFIKKIFGFGKK